MILLDAGHGTYIKGVNSSPHRGIYGEDKMNFSEGQYNRLIVNGIAFRLASLGVPFHIVAPENKDVDLKVRAVRINKICREFSTQPFCTDSCFLLSVHQNGYPVKSVKGFELFTSPGLTKSDEYAELIASSFAVLFPDRETRFLRDDKKGKEARFYILSKTICPAVLTEWAFMTNDKERERLQSDSGIMEQIDFLADMCARIYFDHIKPKYQ